MKRIFTIVLLSLIQSVTTTGQEWEALGNGLGTGSETIRALAIDASGNIYAGGSFTGSISFIAKWNGSTWENLGSGLNGPVHAIGIKSSTEIYVGGSFTLAGGNTVSNIALWNGSAWSDVGSGLNGQVNCIYIPASGKVLAGGQFNQSGSSPINHISELVSGNWTQVGTGINAVVNAITEHQNVLYAGSDNLSAPVHTFNGTNWSTVGNLTGGKVLALASFSNSLYAGGEFSSPSRAGARWDGSNWSTIVTQFSVGHKISTLYTRSGILYIGGNYTGVGIGSPNYIARIRNSSDPLLGFTVSSELTNGEVLAITNKNGKVIAGGRFTTPSTPTSLNIAITSSTINVDEIGDVIKTKSFFPNPAFDRANLKISTKQFLKNPSLQILDMQSKIVSNFSSIVSHHQEHLEFSIDCSSLSPGSYIYRLSDNGLHVTSDIFIVE